MSEQIMVVKKDDLYNFIRNNIGSIKEYIHFKNYEDYWKLYEFITKNRMFKWRFEVEDDESLKQIIGYTLIRKRINKCKCKNEDIFMNTYFAVKRKNQEENRLNNLYSIGIGGHTKFGDSIISGSYRELEEEVYIYNGQNNLVKYSKLDLMPYGMIVDDSNEVGRVHFGINYLLDIPSDYKVNIKEVDKMTGKFVSTDMLDHYYPKMEGWSKILYNNIINI